MVSKSKTFVVVNPEAAGGLGRRLWPQVSEELRKGIGPFDFEETTSHGHGRLLAAEAAQAGYPLVVSYGGDGTIHEVANGLYEAKTSRRPTLGILCVGTGGDLIKTLKISKNIQEQIRCLRSPKTRRLDLGQVTYQNNEGRKEKRIFVNIANAGIGAEVVRNTPRFRNWFGRRAAYLLATFYSYFTWHPRRLRIKADRCPEWSKWTQKTYAVVVANGRYFGGGMPIAPSADPSDGYLDLVVVGKTNFLLGTLEIPLTYSKYFVRLPNVHVGRAKSISIHADEPVHLDIDGEPIGSLPATFEILPKALEVKAP
jgi:YegS/Rv2252/BmrU family lipid kinase